MSPWIPQPERRNLPQYILSHELFYFFLASRIPAGLYNDVPYAQNKAADVKYEGCQCQYGDKKHFPRAIFTYRPISAPGIFCLLQSLVIKEQTMSCIKIIFSIPSPQPPPAASGRSLLASLRTPPTSSFPQSPHPLLQESLPPKR